MSMCHLNPELNPSLNPNSFQGISTARCTRCNGTGIEQIEQAIKIYNQGYKAGHHDTVEGGYVDIHDCDMTTYHQDVVSAIINDEGPSNDTPVF